MNTNNKLTKWEQMMVDYGFFHQEKFNIMTHLIGVPIILVSFFIPFTWIQFANVELLGLTLPLNVATLMIAAVASLYISLDKTLGRISVPALIIILFISTQLGQLSMSLGGTIAAIGFVGGFIFQFIGHGIEGKKPALTAYNPIVAMISSPLFVVAEYAKPFGVHKELWIKVNNEIERLELLKKGEKVNS